MSGINSCFGFLYYKRDFTIDVPIDDKESPVFTDDMSCVNEIVVFNCRKEIEQSLKSNTKAHYVTRSEFDRLKAKRCISCNDDPTVQTISCVYVNTIDVTLTDQERQAKAKEKINDEAGDKLSIDQDAKMKKALSEVPTTKKVRIYHGESSEFLLKPAIESIAQHAIFRGVVTCLNAIHWTVYSTLCLVPLLVRVIMEVAIPALIAGTIAFIAYYGNLETAGIMTFTCSPLIAAILSKQFARGSRLRISINRVHEFLNRAVAVTKPAYTPVQMWNSILAPFPKVVPSKINAPKDNN